MKQKDRLDMAKKLSVSEFIALKKKANFPEEARKKLLAEQLKALRDKEFLELEKTLDAEKREEYSTDIPPTPPWTGKKFIPAVI